MPFEPIDAPNLAHAAASQIRTLIAQDVLRPGDPLPGERDLAARMGISRTSVRAALQTLVSEGLLISRHGSGLRVSEAVGRGLSDPLITLLESDENALTDYLDFRAMIEGACAAITAERATEPERAAIQQILTRMATAYEAEDHDRLAELDTEFHMALVEAARNVVAIQVTRSLHDLLKRGVAKSRALLFDDIDAQRILHQQHHAIGAAIARRDGPGAQAAMQAHLAYVADAVLRKADERKRRKLAEKRMAWTAENMD